MSVRERSMTGDAHRSPSRHVRSIFRTALAATVGFGGVLLGEYGLRMGSLPAWLLLLLCVGLAAACLRCDRVGFVAAWLGALAAIVVGTIGFASDPEYGVGAVAFFVGAMATVTAVAYGIGFVSIRLLTRSIDPR